MTNIPETYEATLEYIQDIGQEYGADWDVTGSIGRALQGMDFTEEEPEDIDIVTSEKDLELLYQGLEEYADGDITYNAQMQIGDNQLTFHKFEIEMNGVDVEFLGEFKVNGEPVYRDYESRKVQVNDSDIPVVPLDQELEGNRRTGRTEIAGRIEEFLS